MTPSVQLDNAGLDYAEGRFSYTLELDGAGVVAVTGPSGAGKSTMFHLIAGFEVPRFGRVLLDGRDMAGLSPGERPLTYIFQDHNLFAHLDVETNVALGISPALRLGPADWAAVALALEKVGLAGFGKPRGLSGGERQRVAFARALVRKRPILLLDEPFASLDEPLRRSMGDLMVALQRESGMLVLIITHDRQETIRLADRVVEIREGRVAGVMSAESWRAGAQ
jgi:thiamine transport system ATP-binding protein